MDVTPAQKAAAKSLDGFFKVCGPQLQAATAAASPRVSAALTALVDAVAEDAK